MKTQGSTERAIQGEVNQPEVDAFVAAATGGVSPNPRNFREAGFGSFFAPTFRTLLQKRKVLEADLSPVLGFATAIEARQVSKTGKFALTEISGFRDYTPLQPRRHVRAVFLRCVGTWCSSISDAFLETAR